MKNKDQLTVRDILHDISATLTCTEGLKTSPTVASCYSDSLRQQIRIDCHAFLEIIDSYQDNPNQFHAPPETSDESEGGSVKSQLTFFSAEDYNGQKSWTSPCSQTMRQINSKETDLEFSHYL